MVRLCLVSALMCGGFLIGTAPDAGHAEQAPAQAGASRPMPPAAGGEKNVLEGTDDDDSLAGGDGNDWLFGRKGNDVLRGGKGRDTIEGAEGDDTIDGGPDADVIGGPNGAGNDTIRGGEGDDVLDGGDDDDLLDGGPGNDDLDGGDGNDSLRGGSGDDMLAGGDGEDGLSGGAGADRLSGNDGADNLAGGPGNDWLAGGDGTDTLSGDAGDDVLDGGQGNDVLRGGTGNDTMLGSWGADSLDGGEEHDTLFGGDGPDVLNGGSGDDWLLGGVGTDIVNGGDGNDLIVIRAGDVPGGDVESADGQGGDDVLILNGFGESTFPTSAGAAVEARLPDPLTRGAYRLVNIERVEHTHLFTHFSATPDRPASMVLINPSMKAASVGRVAFLAEDGSVSAPVVFTVPPLGTVRVDGSARDAATTGSAQVFASSPIAGMIRGTLPTLGPASIAETALVDSATVPVLEERSSGASTGVVLFNSAFPTNIRFTLRTMAGSEVETWAADIRMAPYSHRVVFVRELYPNLRDFQGVMTVEGGIDRPQEGGPFAATVIQRTGTASAFATYPAIPVSPLPAAQTLHFPRLSSGGETGVSLLLVNPSSTNPARGVLAFFDEAGQPWAVPLNRQTAAASVSYDIPPSGSAVFTTSAGGALRTGSARATVSEGVVSAVLRSVAPNAELFIDSPSGAFTAFITPARRDRSAGVNTEVAVTSTGPGVSLQLRLRDANGTEVAGGTAQLRLPANGQVTRSIDELFPKASTDSFQGTITATAEGGAVAASVRHVSGESPRVAAMPVISLR